MLLQLNNISSVCSWAIWEIEETNSALYHLLDPCPEEKELLEKISHPLKQVEFLAARLALKEILKQWNVKYYGTTKDEHKKSHLKYPNYYISLAHSDKYALAIVHQTKPIGIDIEPIREKVNSVKKKFLNDKELKWVGNDLHHLTKAWCAKEAVYKWYSKKKLSFKENIIISDLNDVKLDTWDIKFTLGAINQDLKISFQELDQMIIGYTMMND